MPKYTQESFLRTPALKSLFDLSVEISGFSPEELIRSINIFSIEADDLAKKLQDGHAYFSKLKLVNVFEHFVMETFEKVEDFGNAKILLQKGYIGRKDSDGNPWTLECAKTQNPNEIYDSIRCAREWPMEQRNSLVNTYKDFISYLNKKTFGYIPIIEDDEVKFTKHKRIKYYDFLHLLSFLPFNHEIIAKLYYFGGSVCCSNILEINIENVDFENLNINIRDRTIYFPMHVFADLNEIIGRRKKGKVFIGRQNHDMSQSTVYRNFKAASIKAGLGDSFTPSMLDTTTGIF